jgi:NAD(P)-dependent dehydrogenase (short-subunit alcohol dehydrogenase family)
MTKSVLITGAARRIGRALAVRLAAQGWGVAVHYHRSADAAAGVVTEITADGGRACTVQGDLADPAMAEPLLRMSAEQLGGLTCLINNAAVFAYDEPTTVIAEQWTEHMDVNLRAPVFLTQAFAAMLPQGANGNVINILDERVWKLAPTHFSYTISKSALWVATRTFAQALAPRIRVNAIGPGPTLPNVQQSGEDFERENRHMLLQRGTTPEEIADAVDFILAAPAMTGQMIALDGGQHLLWQTPDMLDEQGST